MSYSGFLGTGGTPKLVVLRLRFRFVQLLVGRWLVIPNLGYEIVRARCGPSCFKECVTAIGPSCGDEVALARARQKSEGRTSDLGVCACVRELVVLRRVIAPEPVLAVWRCVYVVVQTNECAFFRWNEGTECGKGNEEKVRR